MTKEIKLPCGRTAMVDDDDYRIVLIFCDGWYSQLNHGIRYAVGWNMINGKKKYAGLMHRIILNAQSGELIDHIDRDGLNNTRNNLRFATSSQNLGNSKKRKGTKSRYKGVCWAGDKNKWRVRFTNYYNVGHFSDEIEAAKAYDKHARLIYGEFARLNFPKDGECGVLDLDK